MPKTVKSEVPEWPIFEKISKKLKLRSEMFKRSRTSDDARFDRMNTAYSIVVTPSATLCVA